jgi:predicted membrane protein
MSNQEMQFADPDWKPSQQLDTKTNPQEQEVYNPQPVNADSREQNQWRAAPSAPPQQEGYTGLRPYTGPEPGQMQGGNFRQRPYRRRGRGPWFWIILAIIIISLMSGGFGSRGGFDFGRDSFGNAPIEKPQDFLVNGQPTVVINDTSGAVNVTVGKSNTDVIIQPVNGNNFFGNPNSIQPNISQNGNTVNASVPNGQQGTVDFNVTVPQGANLQLQTDSGDITVNGVDGQMTLATNSGSINASNDVLSGSSIMTTNSGDIRFDGTVGTSGTDQFLTSSGSVDLTVPSTPAFHLDATTNSGSLNTSDFPSVKAQNNNTKASGDVGGSSQSQRANVTINTDSGNIDLHLR